MIWKEKTIWFGFLMTIVLFASVGDKAIHLDETNFLALTSGEFWAPHLIEINWEGRTQRAFDVLSNPPGLSWYLWLARDLDVFFLRSMMIPWVILSMFGVYLFGEAWKKKGREALWIWLVSPFFGVSSFALMPDIPLFALIVSGMALLWDKKYTHVGAFLCGTSALFRYSGISMIPLVLAWAFFYQRRKWWSLGIVVSLPTLFLLAHDVMAYQEWHFWHMISFQAETRSSMQILGQIGAIFAMIFGGFFCVFSFGLKNVKIWGLTIICLGFLLGLSGFTDLWDIWHYFFYGIGFSLVGHAILYFWNEKEYWFILWIFGGIVFLLNLRFMATRYWVPFMLPILLFLSGQISLQKRKILVGIGMMLSFFLTWDDYCLATAQRSLAKDVEKARQTSACKQGYFAGHWGWQYYLASQNWIPIEEEQLIPEDSCIAFSEVSWPQAFQTNCTETNVYIEEQVRFPIRVHSRYSRVNYHSNYLSTEPASMGFAPWGFGFDAWDSAHFFASCTRF